MKPLVLLVIVVAIVIGTWQGQVSARLAAREKELLAKVPSLREFPSESGPKPSTEPAPATKTERTEKRKFDAALYIEKFRKLVLNQSFDEGEFIQRDLLDASSEDILELHELIQKAKIPDDFAAIIYECASSRLLEKDPALASEFAAKGEDINNFIFVMRLWIARDPSAANAWLTMKSQADPLWDKTIRPNASHLEPLDVPSLQLAASIATSPANTDLSGLMKLDGAKLKDTLDDVVTVLPPEGLPALLKRMSESGRPDLVEQILKQYPEPTLAREYLQSASLPPAEFMKAATTLVAGLDPASMGRGMDWFLRATDPESRGDGLREIVTRWSTENPRSASQWLKKLPPGKDREVAEAAYGAALHGEGGR
jgi:hypothetical protein